MAKDSMDAPAVSDVFSVAVSAPVLGHRMWVIAGTEMGNFRDTWPLLWSFL